MNIIERIKGILVQPKEEWKKIETETTSNSTLLTAYLLPLAILGAAAVVIGFSVIGNGTFKGGMFAGIILFLSVVISIYAGGYVTDALAPSFSSEKNLHRSMQLVIYSSTPVLLGSILYIIPDLGWLGLLLGAVYSIYLLFLGLPILKKTPEDKLPLYLIIILLATGIIHYLVSYILWKLMYRVIYRAYYPGM